MRPNALPARLLRTRVAPATAGIALVIAAGCGGGGDGTTDPPAGVLSVSPTTITLTATLAGANPASQTVTVSNSGGGGALGGLSVAVTYGAGQATGWLSATLSSATTPATLTLQATTGGLGVGAFDATVAVSSTDVTGSRSVSVVASVTGSTPVIRYAFDGNLNNSGSAAGLAGTSTSTTFVAGKFGQAIKFDGTATTTATFPGTAAVFAASAKWTISLWYREDVQKTFAVLWSMRGTTGGWESYHGGTADAMTTCSDGGCLSFGSTASVWHNLTYRYDGVSTTVGAPVEIFLDGVLVGTLSNPTALPLATAGIIDMKIGGDQGIGPSVFAIDELRVYNAVFTPANQCTQVIGGTWTGTSCTLP